MKLYEAVVLLATGAALAGCASLEEFDRDIEPSATDGAWCGFPHDGSARVFVNIRYGAGGRPSASPASCEVKRGTVVIWRGPEGSPVHFELDFPGGPPDGSVATAGRHGTRRSASRAGERHKVEIPANGPPGTYKYGITANGVHVDPDLRIKPN